MFYSIFGLFLTFLIDFLFPLPSYSLFALYLFSAILNFKEKQEEHYESNEVVVASTAQGKSVYFQ
jgi:hypothetical protein